METKNQFFQGALILSIAGILVKILGAIYRIPLANLIKDEGMGYYQTAYPFYVLLLTISTSGLPIAIAKLVSERRAYGDYKGAHRVFKIALLGLTLGGVLSGLFILINARNLVSSINNENAYYALLALVPALFFVPTMAAFRGYYQGRKNMVPTAISQIVEQVLRVVLGLYLTYMLIGKGIPKAAGGASFGGSAGAIGGTLVIFLIHVRNRKTISKEISDSQLVEEYRSKDIIRDLLIIALPITIGSAIGPIIDAIDASLVINRLQAISYTREAANGLYGQLKGFAQTLVNMPQVFSLAIGSSLVPAISEAKAQGNSRQVKKLIDIGIRLTILIGLPCSFGLFILAKPIVKLLYFNNTIETINSAGNILIYLSTGVVFLTLVQTLTSILQSLGKPFIPVINIFIGALLKLLLTYVLISFPSINVKGAAISTVVAYATACSLNYIYLVKVFKIKLSFKKNLIKPLISSLAMVIIVRLCYGVLLGFLSETLTTIVSILVGGLVYVILLIITGIITDEDMVEVLARGKLAKKLNIMDTFKKRGSIDGENLYSGSGSRKY